MIFHIPTSHELESTTEMDTTALYDADATYSDGDEVKQTDGIYSVTNYQDLDYEAYNKETSYDIGDRVLYAGKIFEKYNQDLTFVQKYGSSNGNMNPNPDTGLMPTTPDATLYGAWDGNTSSTATVLDSASNKYTITSFSNVDKSGLPEYCISDVTIKEYDGGNLLSSTTLTQIHIYYNLDKTGLIGSGLGVNGGFYLTNNIISFSPNNSDKWYQVDTNKHKLQYLRKLKEEIPFDSKQYTTVQSTSTQVWKTKLLEESNAIAVGNIKGNTIHFGFMNQYSTIIANVQINISDYGVLDTVGKTIIAYLPSGTNSFDVKYIKITIDGIDTQVGMILPTSYIDVGATNLEFEHTIKNYDRNKVSEISGYVEHIKGNRAIYHKGSFDIPLSDYDKTVSINKELTQELIAIDGSDTTANEASDSVSRFDSTKLIGRVKSLSTATKATNKNSIDDYLKVSFDFEEVV